MDFFLDIVSFILRFLHVIAAISWIGASFYFVMLDNSLTISQSKSDKEKGIHGDLWAVHGGGFYHSQKYLMGPLTTPLSQNLHWSKWEAYTTWISGFFLFALMYWGSANIYLIDTNVAELTKTSAILLSAGFIFGTTLVYHVLCNFLYKNHAMILLGIISIILIIEAILVCQLFSGRGAFIVFGAILATIMAANVFLVIIPGQKKMVHAISNNLEVDPEPGKQAKVRSMHNTFFTLPVIFAMISNHYSIFYSNEFNWLILILVTVAGALIRSYFVARHQTQSPSFYPIVFAIYCFLAVIFLVRPTTDPVSEFKNNLTIDSETIINIIGERCTVCHSQTPTQAGFNTAPKSIAFDDYESITKQANIIYSQSVLSTAMPIGNITNMTEQERAIIKTWFNQL